MSFDVNLCKKVYGKAELKGLSVYSYRETPLNLIIRGRKETRNAEKGKKIIKKVTTDDLLRHVVRGAVGGG